MYATKRRMSFRNIGTVATPKFSYEDSVCLGYWYHLNGRGYKLSVRGHDAITQSSFHIDSLTSKLGFGYFVVLLIGCTC